MQAGAVQATGSSLDVAVQGDGMFRVATHDGATFGEIMFTRAGNFTRDSVGDMVTPEGYYVVGYTLDAAGAPTTTETKITIPPTAASISIGQDGIVSAIDSAGAVTGIAALTLAKFPND